MKMGASEHATETTPYFVPSFYSINPINILVEAATTHSLKSNRGEKNIKQKHEKQKTVKNGERTSNDCRTVTLSCQKPECSKIARRGGLPFCVAHGGGRRCNFNDCKKGAVSGGLQFCRAHRGGPRCQFHNCHKSAARSTKYCVSHGGGSRCHFDKCTKSAVCGGLPFCVAHGGGHRCQTDSCKKSAIPGGLPFCIAHGGGRRCQFDGCKKGAQRSMQYCVAHREILLYKVGDYSKCLRYS
mmetsp:Transcript_18177/g.20990  ORF Transcript_18177/g.20990 Transcript_18177/m.20990 type:complete len:241 (-) Transcript_18177:5-727(-)